MLGALGRSAVIVGGLSLLGVPHQFGGSFPLVALWSCIMGELSYRAARGSVGKVIQRHFLESVARSAAHDFHRRLDTGDERKAHLPSILPFEKMTAGFGGGSGRVLELLHARVDIKAQERLVSLGYSAYAHWIAAHTQPHVPLRVSADILPMLPSLIMLGTEEQRRSAIRELLVGTDPLPSSEEFDPYLAARRLGISGADDAIPRIRTAQALLHSLGDPRTPYLNEAISTACAVQLKGLLESEGFREVELSQSGTEVAIPVAANAPQADTLPRWFELFAAAWRLSPNSMSCVILNCEDHSSFHSEGRGLVSLGVLMPLMMSDWRAKGSKALMEADIGAYPFQRTIGHEIVHVFKGVERTRGKLSWRDVHASGTHRSILESGYSKGFSLDEAPAFLYFLKHYIGDLRAIERAVTSESEPLEVLIPKAAMLFAKVSGDCSCGRESGGTGAPKVRDLFVESKRALDAISTSLRAASATEEPAALRVTTDRQARQTNSRPCVRLFSDAEKGDISIVVPDREAPLLVSFDRLPLAGSLRELLFAVPRQLSGEILTTCSDLALRPPGPVARDKNAMLDAVSREWRRISPILLACAERGLAELDQLNAQVAEVEVAATRCWHYWSGGTAAVRTIGIDGGREKVKAALVEDLRELMSALRAIPHPRKIG